MTRRRSTLAVAALFALAVLPAAAAPAIAGETARARHDRIVAHWTDARLKAAIPRDFVRSADGRLQPVARPAKPPRPSGGGGESAGASWPNGSGAVYRVTGKVFFDMAGGSWVCSGSVATDSRSGVSIVLTAAHCAYDEAGDRFATNWLFIPQYDSSPTTSCANTAFGCWTASGLVVHDGYASRESFDDPATWHDFAFAVVAPGGKSGSAQLDQIVGSFPITFDSFGAGTRMAAFGYPAAGKYKGHDLTYCSGPVSFDGNNANRTYAMTCDMTGGSSGGPWLSGFSTTTGNGTLSSLNSYGYSGVKAMFGPKFNSTTQAVYNRANTSSGNSIVQ